MRPEDKTVRIGRFLGQHLRRRNHLIGLYVGLVVAAVLWLVMVLY